jgi:hypothetical protein
MKALVRGFAVAFETKLNAGVREVFLNRVSINESHYSIRSNSYSFGKFRWKETSFRRLFRPRAPSSSSLSLSRVELGDTKGFAVAFETKLNAGVREVIFFFFITRTHRID